jgi:hypothetical protein
VWQTLWVSRSPDSLSLPACMEKGNRANRAWYQSGVHKRKGRPDCSRGRFGAELGCGAKRTGSSLARLISALVNLGGQVSWWCTGGIRRQGGKALTDYPPLYFPLKKKARGKARRHGCRHSQGVRQSVAGSCPWLR